MVVEAEVEEVEPEADYEEEDDDDNPDVLYEANVMQEQRILDDDDVRVFSSRSVRKNNEQLKVVNPFVFTGEGDDEWQIQRAYRLKRKLRRIIIHELGKKDVMQDERAKMVSNVMITSLPVHESNCTEGFNMTHFILLLFFHYR